MTAMTTNNLPFPPIDPDEKFRYWDLSWKIGKVWTLILEGRDRVLVDVLDAHETFLAGEDYDIKDNKHWTDNGDGTRTYNGKFSQIGISNDLAMSDKINLDIPLIVAPVMIQGKSVGHMVIDGWHRIRRAKVEGRETLEAFALTEDESNACRIDDRWRIPPPTLWRVEEFGAWRKSTDVFYDDLDAAVAALEDYEDFMTDAGVLGVWKYCGRDDSDPEPVLIYYNGIQWEPKED